MRFVDSVADKEFVAGDVVNWVAPNVDDVCEVLGNLIAVLRGCRGRHTEVQYLRPCKSGS